MALADMMMPLRRRRQGPRRRTTKPCDELSRPALRWNGPTPRIAAIVAAFKGTAMTAFEESCRRSGHHLAVESDPNPSSGQVYPVHVMTRKSFGLMMRKLSDGITVGRPTPGNFLTQEAERGIGELGASGVGFVVGEVPVHDSPEPLDRIEMRAIGRNEMQLDPAAGPREPSRANATSLPRSSSGEESTTNHTRSRIRQTKKHKEFLPSLQWVGVYMAASIKISTF